VPSQPFPPDKPFITIEKSNTLPTTAFGTEKVSSMFIFVVFIIEITSIY
jgi:hypothetical protein